MPRSRRSRRRRSGMPLSVRRPGPSTAGGQEPGASAVRCWTTADGASDEPVSRSPSGVVAVRRRAATTGPEPATARTKVGWSAGTLTVVHETAHQWFGDSVTLTDWHDIWLAEGWATYAEWLWTGAHGGKSPQDHFDDLYAMLKDSGLSDEEMFHINSEDVAKTGFSAPTVDKVAHSVVIANRAGEDDRVDFDSFMRPDQNAAAAATPGPIPTPP